VKASYLDEVLALWLGDKGLKLRGSEGVDETGLRDDQQKHLSTSED
jgi:hypothetical protein